MRTLDLMTVLIDIAKVYGNLPVVGANMADDLPLTDVCVVDAEGRDATQDGAGKAIGVFLIA